MNLSRLAGVVGLLIGFGLAGGAHAVDLYPTGPSEDAAFVRFVNAGLQKLDISAKGGASVELDGSTVATRFFPVTAGSDITGKLVSGGVEQDIALKPAAGEFVTVVAAQGQSPAFSLTVLREQPEDFTAVKAAVAFYNMNADCAAASVQVSGRKVLLFEPVSAKATARRLVNPVKLAVQLLCNGAAVGSPLDMGRLEAGERYSLFLAPGDPAARFFFVMDDVAN